MYMKMQESILKRVYKMEENHNIHYAKVDGKGFSCCRMCVFIFAIWAAFFALVLAVNYLIDLGAFEQGSSEHIQLTKIIVSCFSVVGLLAVCAVLNGLKKAVFACAFALCSSVYGLAFFARIIDRSANGFLGLPYKYYWAHLFPLVAVAIFCIVMAIIAIRERIILKTEYKQVCGRLYEEYSKVAEEISEEQWEDFLTNYTPKGKKNQLKNGQQK